MHRYCVVCEKEIGPSLETHCTDNSLVAMKEKGLFRKETLFFTLDGEALNEDDLSHLRDTEAARMATWERKRKEARERSERKRNAQLGRERKQKQ